jgi:D-glycero-alpha-D-manno-heptose 1-phosphate guanylyltransferase
LKAVILAGGFGTRLRSTISDRPKPMALVLGKPFLEYLIRFLRSQGMNEIVLCLHFLADQIMEYFGEGSHFGVRYVLRFKWRHLPRNRYQEST